MGKGRGGGGGSRGGGESAEDGRKGEAVRRRRRERGRGGRTRGLRASDYLGIGVSKGDGVPRWGP